MHRVQLDFLRIPDPQTRFSIFSDFGTPQHVGADLKFDEFHENPRFLGPHWSQSGNLKIGKSRFSRKNALDVFITTQTIHIVDRKWSESRHPDFRGGDFSKNSKKSGFGGGGLRPKNRCFLGGLNFKSAPTCWWVPKFGKIHFRVRIASRGKKSSWSDCNNF